MSMMYKSTRGSAVKLTSAQAIKKGIADDGGLYMPESIPRIDLDYIKKLAPMSYGKRAESVLSLYLDDYGKEALEKICKQAYSESRFGSNAAPVVKLSDAISVLELWHGPTSAFKDMALQIMPRLLSGALDMTKEKKTALILVATSGDTGKAALEGYRDVDGTKIMVFYPENGVSGIQKLQMCSQEGNNVNVVSIKGNFDDAQTGVKNIFSDDGIKTELEEKGVFLSSANSINWGRLAPQIVYYFSAYCDMANSGAIKIGEEINIAVPTGNFGNIFAAYMAKRMGLPIKKLICASNKNNILTDFINTGVYDRNREFYQTSSPSMDILISSNLERLLYALTDEATTRGLLEALSRDGRYEITSGLREKIQKEFYGDFCSEQMTAQTIKNTFERYGYLLDTHTATGLYCANEYINKTGDRTKMLCVSTASAYKFAPDVYKALAGAAEKDEFDASDKLYRLTKKEIPLPLAGLKEKRRIFTKSVGKSDMASEVLSFS